MTSPRPHQVCPPFGVLDALERQRLGVVPAPGAPSVPLDGPDRAAAAAHGLEVVDPEGVPIALFAPRQIGATGAVGRPTWLGRSSDRPYERLFETPEQVRASAGEDTVPVLVDRVLTAHDAAAVAELGAPRPVLLLVLAGPTRSPHSAGVPRLRRAVELAGRLPEARVVAVPLDPADAAADPVLLRQVVSSYTGHPVRHLDPGPGRHPGEGREPADGGRPGVVLFLTGLSGSGKSTVARAVRAAIIETEGRSVSLLDGDLVRRTLSAGLTFSPEDRDTNIRRIGWVAAEVAYHGGMAICSPIAPYDATRQAVRAMVEEAGGRFVLVHVSTPLEECVRRDRKGLYARARAGEIPDFTGVSAPYEAPTDADLDLDTTGLTVDAARDRVLDLLRRRGLLGASAAPPRPA